MALGAGAGMLGLAAMGTKAMKGAKAKKAAEALAKLKAEKASKMRKRVAAGAAIGGGAGLAALLSKKASAKVKVAAAFITKIAAMSPAERKAFAEAMEAFLASGKKIKKLPPGPMPKSKRMTVRGHGVHSASRQGKKGGAVSGLADLGIRRSAGLRG